MALCFKSFPLLAAIAILLSACSKTPQANYLDDAPVVAIRTLIDGEEFIEMDPSLLKDTIFFPLSYFTEELQIVKLDDREEALTNAPNVFLSDNYFLTISNGSIPYKLFDKQGKYLADIGAIGPGPGEYRFIYGGSLDEANQRIYLMPFLANDLLVYDLEGNALPPVPLAYKGTISTFSIQNNELVVMATPQHALSSCVWVQDFDGNLLSYISGSNFNFEFLNTTVFSFRNEDHIDLNYWTRNPRADSLYHVDLKRRKLIPRFAANFKGDALKPHMYSEWPGYYLGDTSTILTVTVRDEDGNVQQRKEGDEPSYYIVNKNTLKGAYIVLIDDFFGGIRFENPFVFHGKYYSTCMDPGDLADRIEQALQSDQLTDKMRRKLTEVQANMTGDDNNYVLYAKLKP